LLVLFSIALVLLSTHLFRGCHFLDQVANVLMQP
jgi:hypothetical protein